MEAFEGQHEQETARIGREGIGTQAQDHTSLLIFELDACIVKH